MTDQAIISLLAESLATKCAEEQPYELRNAHKDAYKAFLVRIFTALDVSAEKLIQEARQGLQKWGIRMPDNTEFGSLYETWVLAGGLQQQGTSCSKGNEVSEG